MINMFNAKTMHSAFNNNNNKYLQTVVYLHLELIFNDFTQIPLSNYNSNDYSINITEIETLNDKYDAFIRPEKIIFNTNPSANTYIKFMFNKSHINSFDFKKNYKFQLKLDLNNCNLNNKFQFSKEFEINLIDNTNTSTMFNNVNKFQSMKYIPKHLALPPVLATTKLKTPKITATTTTDVEPDITTTTLSIDPETTTMPFITLFNSYKIIHVSNDEQHHDMHDIRHNNQHGNNNNNLKLTSLIKNQKNIFNNSLFKIIIYSIIVIFSLIILLFIINLLIINYKQKQFNLKKSLQMKLRQQQELALNWKFLYNTNNLNRLSISMASTLTAAQTPPSAKIVHSIHQLEPEEPVVIEHERKQIEVNRKLNNFQPIILSNTTPINQKKQNEILANNEFDFVLPDKCLFSIQQLEKLKQFDTIHNSECSVADSSKAYYVSSRKSGDFNYDNTSIATTATSVNKKSLIKSTSFKQVKDWICNNKPISTNQSQQQTEQSLSESSQQTSQQQQQQQPYTQYTHMNLLNNSLLPKTIVNGYLNRWSTPNNPHHILSLASITSSNNSYAFSGLNSNDSAQNTTKSSNATNNSNSSTTCFINYSAKGTINVDNDNNTNNNNNTNNCITTLTNNTNNDSEYLYEDMANYFENLKESRA